MKNSVLNIMISILMSAPAAAFAKGTSQNVFSSLEEAGVHVRTNINSKQITRSVRAADVVCEMRGRRPWVSCTLKDLFYTMSPQTIDIRTSLTGDALYGA